MKCTFSNQQQTASSLSFDISCTSARAPPPATPSSAWRIPSMGRNDPHDGGDEREWTLMNATMDGTSTYTYLGSDCGNVKPDSPWRRPGSRRAQGVGWLV